MRFLVFGLMLTMNSVVYGQVPARAVNSAYPNFQIGVNFSADYCFRTLKNNDGSPTSDVQIKLNNDLETSKLSYTEGISFCYQFNKRLGLETGIFYSNKGYQTKKVDARYSLTDSLDNTNPVTHTRVRYNFHYLDIPIQANFSLGEQRLRLISSIGLVTNILLKGNNTNVVYRMQGREKATIPSKEEFKKLNISPIIGIGMNYHMNDQSSLRIQPVFRYGMLKIIDTPVTGYLYNLGVDFGYYLNIGGEN